jgi:hypothetical protein
MGKEREAGGLRRKIFVQRRDELMMWKKRGEKGSCDWSNVGETGYGPYRQFELAHACTIFLFPVSLGRKGGFLVVFRCCHLYSCTTVRVSGFL